MQIIGPEEEEEDDGYSINEVREYLTYCISHSIQQRLANWVDEKPVINLM